MKYAVLLPFSILLASCAKEAAVRPAPAAANAISVQTTQASQLERATSYEATGTVRARTLATISSKVTGYVQQLSVAEGDHVNAGQLLITLDWTPVIVALRSRAQRSRPPSPRPITP